MERLNRHVCHSRGRCSKEGKQSEKEGKEMTSCLYECLSVVGLQHHHPRFISMGVCRAAHLSALTMEDYPLLGIRTVEDSTRLFHLVQMIKALDLDSLEYQDGYGDAADGGDEGCAVVDSSLTYDGRGSPVRRRLNFETTDHLQEQPSYPKGSVHVSSHMGKDVPVQCRGSATTLLLELDRGRAVKRGCQENNSHRTNARSLSSNQHTRRDVVGGIAVQNSHTRLSSKCVSIHKQKHWPAPVASTFGATFNSKPVGHKDRKTISKKERLLIKIYSTGASGSMAKKKPIYESKRTTGYNYGLPLSSPPAQNKTREGEPRISVCVRKKPLTRAQGRRGEADVVTTPVGECVIVRESKEAVDLTEYIQQHKFYFDQVFGEESTNEEVYQTTAYPLVQHMLSGGKATCFAYGQTGAGKTHTMLGSSTGGPGLYALAVQDIFAHLSSSHMPSPLLVHVSFFEIYCGQLYDLLDHRKRLFAREDGQNVVHIVGLRDVRVDSVSSLLQVISKGTEERKQGASGVNPLSSRSHALLQIQIRDPNHQIRGRLWFVDLAGSEKASDTRDPNKQSRMEGAEINQSLLVLKECIRSLDQEQPHTPFRQSKLTLVLKDSFVGDSMTCMIANISPGHLATKHTLNTLRYADRVKQLRGQGGGRGKTIPSPKHNMLNSSSVVPQGKSPPKKPKLGRQPEAFVPTSPNTRSAGDTNICSTPKNSRWMAKTSAMGTEGIGLEHVTPIRGCPGLGDTRHEASERNVRRGKNEMCEGINVHPEDGHDVKTGLVMAPPTDEQRHRREGQNLLIHRPSGKGEKGNQKSPVKGGRVEEGGWLLQQRQVECSRDTGSEVEQLRERDLQLLDEQDKERQRHMRIYHQQLQQFTFSSSFSLSTLSSSLHSSASPLSSSPSRQDSHLSASALTYQDVEDVLDVHRAGVQVRADANRAQWPVTSDEICLQTELSPSCNNNHDRDDSGGVGDHLLVSWEGTEGRREQDKGDSGKRRLVEQPAGMEGPERRCAWLATVKTEQEDRVTGVILTDAGAQVCCSCRSVDRGQRGEEGLHPTDDPVERSTDWEGDSPPQRAPAERPLSQGCEHVNTLLTPNKVSDRSLESMRISNIPHLPLQNAPFSNSPSTPRPLSTSIPQSRCKTTEPLDKLSECPVYTQVKNYHLAQHEKDTDSLSYTMDPLSLSMLQVDQQAATSSFLRREQSDPSLCLLGNERGGNTQSNVVKEQQTCAEMTGKPIEVQDVDLHLSCLELPQAKTQFPTTSDTGTAINHTERRKDTCGIGKTNPLLPEVMPVLLQDRKNNQKLQTMPVLSPKAPASQLGPSACAPMQTPIVQSTSPSVQHSEDIHSAGHAHNMHSKPDSSTSTPQSEGVLDQCHIVRSTQKDLNRAMCRVVQAHLENHEEMQALCHEGTLLLQQPNMAFGEYVHKLDKIVVKQALCVDSMRAQLQTYLMLSQSTQTRNQ